MPWPFCPQCGTIMNPPTDDYVRCLACPFECLFESLGVEEVVTVSKPIPKPSWITEEEEDSTGKKHAIIDEPCPKCGNPEMFFYTMQLRSADEGSTVFYECPRCNHKFNQNN